MRRFLDRVRLFFAFLFIKLGLALFFIKGDGRKFLPYGQKMRTLHNSRSGRILLELSLATSGDELNIQRQEFMLELWRRVKEACQELPFRVDQQVYINHEKNEFLLHVHHQQHWFGPFYRVIVSQSTLRVQLDNLTQVITGLNKLTVDEGVSTVVRSFHDFVPPDGVDKEIGEEEDDLPIKFMTKDTTATGIKTVLTTASDFVSEVLKRAPRPPENMVN